MLFKQKQRVDLNPRLKWKTYWKKQWDDLAVALILPQFLIFFYEAGYSLWVHFLDKDWDFYYDTYEGMAIVFGLFGVLIYTRLLKKGQDKIEKL
jgi:hypothetical protein